MDLNRDDRLMREVLAGSRTIAVVGHSDNPARTSYQIARFLRDVGYVVYPVNPMVSEIDGQKCYASLQDVPDAIDLVNVFRRSEFLLDIVDEAHTVGAAAVWAQLGVDDPAARQRALELGLHFAGDVCIKVEYRRLGITNQ